MPNGWLSFEDVTRLLADTHGLDVNDPLYQNATTPEEIRAIARQREHERRYGTGVPIAAAEGNHSLQMRIARDALRRGYSAERPNLRESTGTARAAAKEAPTESGRRAALRDAYRPR